ncbi:effector-associated constant component EACC1 [Nocardiopsis alba]|uniref:effector-associated constant component EACC1 n=1 Tax=Nocardiopsis alba TaxID=53437 RepID=UPI0033B7CB7D
MNEPSSPSFGHGPMIGGGSQGQINNDLGSILSSAAIVVNSPAFIGGTSAVGTALTTMIITWLRQRRSTVTIKAIHPSGQVYEVEATKLLNPQGYTEHALKTINESQHVEITEVITGDTYFLQEGRKTRVVRNDFSQIFSTDLSDFRKRMEEIVNPTKEREPKSGEETQETAS